MGTKIFYNKLVRDKLPEIIKSLGGNSEIRILDEKEYVIELKRKLIEEAQELQNATTDEIVDELADQLELIKSIAKHHNISFSSVAANQASKRKIRGGFAKRIFLIWSSTK